MAIYSDVGRAAVIAAIERCDELGRDRFLKEHGYRGATKYVLLYDGKEGEYDSKAILHVAWSYQHPEQEPLSHDAFSGGLNTVVPHLLELGFKIKDLSTDELLTLEDVGRSSRSSQPSRFERQEDDIWTQARALALRDEVPHSLREVIDYLASVAGRKVSADELVDALGLRDVGSLKGILSHLTHSTKRLGIPQEVEHTWFILWEREPRFRYWLSQKRADWWTGNHPRKFWAFAANPEVYRIGDAVSTLGHDWWTIGSADVQPGDAILFWKTRAGDDHRGVVALGEVESGPTVRSDSDNPYWVDSQRASEVEPRVLVRYHPLPREVWLTPDADDPLRQLSVSRAHGGTVFQVQPNTWESVLSYIGGWSRTVSRRLERSDWARSEWETTIDAYALGLKADLRNEDYSPSEVKEQLSEVLPNRLNSDIVPMLEKVSAVFVEMGLPYLEQWSPTAEYDEALYSLVDAHLTQDDELVALLADLAASEEEVAESKLGDIDLDSVFTEPPAPPSQRPTDNTATSRPKPSRIDYAAREASNRRLGRQGEQFVLKVERKRLREAGRGDLAGDVEWVADTVGDGLGYDVRSFEPDGSPLFIEVKTTQGGSRTAFFISANEIEQSKQRGESYRLYRVFNFGSSPQVFVLSGSVADTCELSPTVYRARSGKVATSND